MELTQEFVAAALEDLPQRDPLLGLIIERVGEFTLKPSGTPFESLVRSILAQQISTTVARTLMKRLKERLAPKRVAPNSLSALSFDDLRSLGLSRQKASYLQDLTQRTLDRSVRMSKLHQLSDEEVIAEVTQVKGIGVWTAQMLLIFCLGRADVFAPDDFGLRSAIQKLYRLPEMPKKAEAGLYAEKWRPYGTVASWYLWRSLELPTDDE